MAPKVYVMQASPPCRAVLMTAKAIGLELDLEEVGKEDLRTPEMLEINPQHTVPTLVDDDFILWDSHAIMGYLVGAYAEDDSLYPKDDIKKRALIDQRLHFENGVLYERMRAACFSLFLGEPEVPEEERDRLLEALGFLEAFLDDREWLAGDAVTIADLSVLATVATAELFLPLDAERFPRLNEWYERAKALEYFAEANEAGLRAFKEMMPNVGPQEGEGDDN